MTTGQWRGTRRTAQSVGSRGCEARHSRRGSCSPTLFLPNRPWYATPPRLDRSAWLILHAPQRALGAVVGGGLFLLHATLAAFRLTEDSVQLIMMTVSFANAVWFASNQREVRLQHLEAAGPQYAPLSRNARRVSAPTTVGGLQTPLRRVFSAISGLFSPEPKERRPTEIRLDLWDPIPFSATFLCSYSPFTAFWIWSGRHQLIDVLILIALALFVPLFSKGFALDLSPLSFFAQLHWVMWQYEQRVYDRVLMAQNVERRIADGLMMPPLVPQYANLAAAAARAANANGRRQE